MNLHPLTRCLALIALLTLGLSDVSFAVPTQGQLTMIGPTSTTLVPQTANWGSTPMLITCGYNNCGDQGGTTIQMISGTCVVDNITCFKDGSSTPHYFSAVGLSDQFGLLNVLKAGCKPDVVNGLGTAATNCFNQAQTAAALAGLAGINICGNSTGSSFLLDQNFTSTGYIGCPTNHQNRSANGTGTVGLPNSADWTHFPNTLWLASGKTFFCGVSAGSNCKGEGFSLIRAGINGAGTGAAPASLRDTINMVAAESGTCLQINSDNPDLRSLNVYGCATGITTSTSNRARDGLLRDINIDATQNHLYWKSQRGGGNIVLDNVNAGCNLTCLSAFSLFSTGLSNVQDGASFGFAGHLVLTLTAACTDTPNNCPITGDLLYVTGAHSAESSGGQPFTAQIIDTSHILLPHASSAFLTGQNFTAATTNLSGGAAVGNATLGWDTIQISGITPTCPLIDNVWCQVQPNQQITDLTNANCINNGSAAYVGFVDYWSGWVTMKTSPTGAIIPAQITCTGGIQGHTIQFLDNAFAFSFTSATIAAAGLNYQSGDLITIPGGTCSVQPVALVYQVNKTTGAATKVVPDTAGVCSVFPPSPTGVLSGGSGTGLNLNIFFSGAVQMDTGSRGNCFHVGNTITLTATHLFAIQCTGISMWFDDGSAGSLVSNMQIYTNQALQNAFTEGVEFTGTAHENVIDGCSIHAFGGNIVNRTTAPSNLGSNTVKNCAVGGNNKNSGANQILARIDSPTLGQSAQATLKLDIDTNIPGAVLVSSDVETPTGVKMGTSNLPNSNVFVQNPADSLAVDLGEATPSLARYTHGTPIATSPLTGVINPTSTTYAVPDCAPPNQNLIGTGAAGSVMHVYFPSSPCMNQTIHTLVDKTFGVVLELGSNKLSSISGDLTGTVTLNGVAQASSYIDFVYNGVRWIGRGDFAFLVANGLIPVPSGAHSTFTHTTIGSSTTLDSTARMWLCNATGGPIVFTVPLGSTVPGALWTIKKIDASANTCSVTMSGSDTLDGATGSPSSGIISTQWGKLTIWNNTNNTANWYIQ